MGRSSRSARRSKLQAAADRHSEALSLRLGKMLKDARASSSMTQAQAAATAGFSQSTWSWLELGADGRATVATWSRAAAAVGASLDAFIRRASAADQPRDIVHLRGQELVIRQATPGGWHALPEAQIDRDARTSRAVDVLLWRGLSRGHPPIAAAEYALIEIWNWLDEVGGPIREWDRRLDAVERYAIARMTGDQPVPRVSGCWVLRATQRNRRLVKEHHHFFRARFRGSGRAWLDALGRPEAKMPATAALLWVSVDGTRVFSARLG